MSYIIHNVVGAEKALDAALSAMRLGYLGAAEAHLTHYAKWRFCAKSSPLGGDAKFEELCTQLEELTGARVAAEMRVITSKGLVWMWNL